MRRAPLMLVAPLLGTSLIAGAAGVSQAAHLNGHTETRTVHSDDHVLTSALKPPDPKNRKKPGTAGDPLSDKPYAQGFRLGYSTGYPDGFSACRTMRKMARIEIEKKINRGVAAFRQGFATGYPPGFSAGCAAAKRG